MLPFVPRNLGTARQKERPRKGTTVRARTTQVDRRLASMLLEGIPGDIPEGTIRRHLGNKALFHRGLGALLRADLTKVHLEAVIRLLQEEMRQFAPGVLDRVRALGGQFAKARMTEVPDGETLESQRRDEVIKFWTDWHFDPTEARRLKVAPSIESQVIYLPDLVESSLNCNFDKAEEGRLSVQEILDSLPRVEGLRWIVGSASTVNRVLANHLKEKDEYLLPHVNTWTTDEYVSPGGRHRLIVGDFSSVGVDVFSLRPGRWNDNIGLFVLGVPE